MREGEEGGVRGGGEGGREGGVSLSVIFFTFGQLCFAYCGVS